MNSCLYECNVMHYRARPKKHKLTARMFMFYLNLDEIDMLAKRLAFFSRNRRNIYSFRDSDHISFKGSMVKENIIDYLRSQGVKDDVGRIMLLTNLRTFGYIFNPVSFYFCFDKEEKPLCAVAEIGNTFREFKPFLMGREFFRNGQFDSTQTKFYYVSPFMDMDLQMNFIAQVPGERLKIRVDDLKDGEKFFWSTLAGKQKELSNWNLLKMTLKFPFVTLKVIFLIHFHALLLYLKGIPYYNKEDKLDLQKGAYRAWCKN